MRRDRGGTLMRGAPALRAVALCVALAAQPCRAAETAAPVPPPGKAPVLRHLSFAYKLASTYSYEKRGAKDLADAQGGNTAGSQDRMQSDGTIVADVVAALQDGALVIDVREDSRDRGQPVSRVSVSDRGEIAVLANSKTLSEEETMLLRLLGRNVIGPWKREVGEAWNLDTAAKNYKASTHFRVASFPAPDDERVDVEEQYAFSGAEAYSGTMNAKVAFDPTKSVPRSASVTTRTRLDRMGQYTTVNLSVDFALREDSFAKK